MTRFSLAASSMIVFTSDPILAQAYRSSMTVSAPSLRVHRGVMTHPSWSAEVLEAAGFRRRGPSHLSSALTGRRMRAHEAAGIFDLLGDKCGGRGSVSSRDASQRPIQRTHR